MVRQAAGLLGTRATKSDHRVARFAESDIPTNKEILDHAVLGCEFYTRANHRHRSRVDSGEEQW